MSVNATCRGPACRAPGARSFLARATALAPAALLTALLTACGGGGGSSFDDGGASLLTVYNYEVTNPGGGPASLVRTLITPELPDDVYAINAGVGTVVGAYSRATGNFTVSDATTFTVNWSGAGPVPAQFSVAVTAELALAFGDFQPDEGAFAVTWGEDIIAVEYDANPAGDTRITLNDDAPVLLTPVTFNQLDEPGTVAPDWQRVAARSSQAVLDLLNQVRSMAGFMEDVFDGQLDNDQSFTCEAIPGVPPGGVLNPGTLDRDNLGGDDYLIDATDCFNPSSIVSTVGFLANGTISYQNLGSVANDDDVITRASLDQVVLDTTVEQLSEGGGGNWNFTGNATLYDGGFALEFTAPVP